MSRLKTFLLAVALTGFTACATIAPYSERAYDQAVSLKVESLQLMSKAVEPYEQHKTEVAELQLNVEKAYEYAKGRPKNEDSTRQWEILKSEDAALLGGFIKRWRDAKTLAAAFVAAAKTQISQAFDQIIELESGKAGGGKQ